MEGYCDTCTSMNKSCLESGVRHIPNICTIDDTNMTLQGSDGIANGHTRVVTVMNNCQNLVVRYDDDGTGQSKSAIKAFVVHTPLVPLERANASSIAAEFISWIFLWLGACGERWLHFTEHVGLSWTNHVPIQCVAICWDSLKTNLAVLKGLRNTVYLRLQELKSSADRSGQIFQLFAQRCGLHQVALCRKTLIFYYPQHWSSIVRLAHLFESHSFRVQFRKSLVTVIASSFELIAVPALPHDHDKWQSARDQLFDSCTKFDGHRHHISRLNAYKQLQILDNGDPHANKIVHWCLVENCGCRRDSGKCLIDLCKCYCTLFGSGFSVPLTYRWKHAGPALAYCKDTWLLTSEGVQSSQGLWWRDFFACNTYFTALLDNML